MINNIDYKQVLYLIMLFYNEMNYVRLRYPEIILQYEIL